jgi:hypothetical protein
MTLQEKAERDALLDKMRNQTLVVMAVVAGSTSLIGYKVAGAKGAVLAPVALFTVFGALALAMANR